MAAKETTGIAYTVLMPRLARAGAGEPTETLNEFSGTVPKNAKRIEVIRRHGSPIGRHAHVIGAPQTLCGCNVVVDTSGKDGHKATAERVGKLGDFSGVTCSFCQVRLIAAGHMKATDENVTEYAKDYGTRKALVDAGNDPTKKPAKKATVAKKTAPRAKAKVAPAATAPVSNATKAARAKQAAQKAA